MVTAVEEFEQSILFYADAYEQRASALRLRSCPTPIPIPTQDSALVPSSCSLPSAAPGAATLREHLIAVSGELENGIAATLSVARASGNGSNEWELELEAGKLASLFSWAVR